MNTAMTGMFASQRNLYTVNHNVANANKEGYSRQQVKTSSNIPLHIAGKGYIGTGIGTDSIERIRDTYLDKKYRTESASFGKWDMKNMALSEIEGVLRGSKEEGINVNLDELFSSIDELSGNPADLSYRTSFREKVVALTKTMNETVKRLYKQQKDLNFEIRTKVKQVNDYSEQISSLNREIFSMEVDGSNANDLRDHRDLLVDKLSKLVDIEFKETGEVPTRKFEITVGGKLLVEHDTVSKLKCEDRMKNVLNENESLYKVEWVDGAPIELKGGEIKGLLEVRDGGYTTDDENITLTDKENAEGLVQPKYDDKDNKGIPYYIKKLDEFSQVLFGKMNEIHFQGKGLGESEKNFLFSIDEKSTNHESLVEIKKLYEDVPSKDTDEYKTYQQNLKIEIKKLVRADNISISGDILDDLNNIATIDGEKGNIGNSSIMKELLKTREDTSFFGEGSAYRGKPEDYLTSILSTLGTDNQQAARMKSVEDIIIKKTINQRLSVSGVNLDEEMANMVKFQQIFNASAKMVTTFDQIYDTVVNRLGMVGR